MIKIIKDRHIKRVTCQNCHSVLEYTDADILQTYYPPEVGKYGIYYTYGGWKDIIICPICRMDVIV